MKKHLLKLIMITLASTFFVSAAFANPEYRESHGYYVEPHYQPQHSYYPQDQHSSGYEYGYSDYGYNDYYYNDHSAGYIQYETYEHAPTIIIETLTGGLHY